MMCQALAWFALPLVLAFGGNAPGDDVTAFLRHSAWSPWAVLAIGLTLAGLSAAVLLLTLRPSKAHQTRAEPPHQPSASDAR